MEKTGVVTIDVDKNNKELEKTAGHTQTCDHPKNVVTIETDGTAFCKKCGCYLNHVRK